LVVAKRWIILERDYFKHELCVIPSLLFDEDGLRKRPNKSDLAKVLFESCKDVDNLCSNKKELLEPHLLIFGWWSSSSWKISGRLEGAFQRNKPRTWNLSKCGTHTLQWLLKDMVEDLQQKTRHKKDL